MYLYLYNIYHLETILYILKQNFISLLDYGLGKEMFRNVRFFMQRAEKILISICLKFILLFFKLRGPVHFILLWEMEVFVP